MSINVTVVNSYKDNLYALIFVRFESALKWEMFLIERIDNELAAYGQLLASITRKPYADAIDCNIAEMVAMSRAWQAE